MGWEDFHCILFSTFEILKHRNVMPIFLNVLNFNLKTLKIKENKADYTDLASHCLMGMQTQHRLIFHVFTRSWIWNFTWKLPTFLRRQQRSPAAAAAVSLPASSLVTELSVFEVAMCSGKRNHFLAFPAVRSGQ